MRHFVKIGTTVLPPNRHFYGNNVGAFLRKYAVLCKLDTFFWIPPLQGYNEVLQLHSWPPILSIFLTWGGALQKQVLAFSAPARSLPEKPRTIGGNGTQSIPLWRVRCKRPTELNEHIRPVGIWQLFEGCFLEDSNARHIYFICLDTANSATTPLSRRIVRYCPSQYEPIMRHEFYLFFYVRLGRQFR